jgi:hypothetical protein
MIDPLLNKIIRPPLALAAKPLVHLGITADQVTIFGFVLGIMAVPAIINEQFILALTLILFNRVMV